MEKFAASVYEKSRRYENAVYASLWLLVAFLPFINEFMRMCHGFPFSWSNIFRWWIGILPFYAIFLLNTYIIVPRYLLKGNTKHYVAILALVVILFVAFQSLTYESRSDIFRNMIEVDEHMMPRGSRPRYSFIGLPMPVVLNFAIIMMLLGANTAIIFMFRYIREKEIRESLETLRLQDELQFLKAQINPHFFMNVLNNIHAMIELAPDKAQDMTIELSKLMRYVLYECDTPTASQAKEINFIRSYVGMLRSRYPENKVEITFDSPDITPEGFVVPPMLFVSFVENAFKHGISYMMKSVIRIAFERVSDSEICFTCVNTIPPSASEESTSGIGLGNVSRRLDLLYGDAYTLEINNNENTYEIRLTIPSL